MNKNCIGKLYIGNSTDDSLSNIELSVEEAYDINLIVEKLIQDKDKIEVIQKILDRNNYNRPVYNKQHEIAGQYDFKKGIPVGTSNVKNLIGISGNIPQHMIDAIQDSGFDLESNNITLDNSMVHKSKFKKIPVVKIQNVTQKRVDSKGNTIEEQQERVILPNRKDAIENYIKYRYIMTQVNNDNLIKVVGQLLSDSFINLSTSDYITKKLQGFQKAFNKDTATGIQQFLQMYYNDSMFFDQINDLTGNNIERILQAFMSTQPSSIFIKGIDKSHINNGIIDAESVRKDLEKQGKSGADPILYIRECVYKHNQDRDNKYIIQYQGNNKLKLIPSTYNESLSKTYVSTRFYSPLVPVYEKYKGYYIYQMGNKFYISKILVDNLDSFKELSDSKLSSSAQNIIEARMKINDSFNKPLNSMNGRTARTLINSENKTISHKKAPISRYIVEVPDIKLPKALNGRNIEYLTLISDKPTYNQAIELLSTNRSFYSIPSNYDLTQVFTSVDNVELFLQAASNIWETSKNKEQDIKDLLDQLKDFTTTPYRVGESNEGKYLYEKIDEVVPVSHTSTKPFRNHLIYAIEQLQKHFGVKIEIINSTDVMSGKYANIPNIHTAKAFILDGVIHVNVDKANNQDLMHEYGHLMLAMLKQRNIETYLKIVQTVQSHPDYIPMRERYRKNGDTRSTYDLQEEIIVELFGRYMGKGMDQIFSKDVQTDYVEAMRNVFMFNKDANLFKPGELNQLSLEEALNLMGSTLLAEQNPFSAQAVKQTIVPRRVANIIKQLINQEELIEENC